MKNFKFFFKNLLYFTLLLPIIYFLMIIIWGDFGPGHLRSNLSYQKLGSGHLTSRIKEVDTTVNVDVLFLGSSRSYRHYDTRIYENLNISAFNLASSAQTFIQMEYFVNKYFVQLNPEIVILDIYPLMFSGDGVESTIDVISNDNIDKDILSLAKNHRNIRVLNTLIYSFYREIFHNSNNLVEKKYKEERKDHYIKGGFVSREIEFSKKEETEDVIININVAQVEAFNNIIKTIERTGAKIHLVCSPMHLSKFHSYSNFYILDSLANEHGLVIEKFIELEGLDEVQHFYDPFHLNQKGVEIFNDAFIKRTLNN